MVPPTPLGAPVGGQRVCGEDQATPPTFYPIRAFLPGPRPVPVLALAPHFLGQHSRETYCHRDRVPDREGATPAGFEPAPPGPESGALTN